MNKSKFKVGDRVQVIKSITGKHSKLKNIGQIFKVTSRFGAGYCYTLDGDTENCYAEEELELVTDNRTYTGIELLQAIKDGVFKDGDEFEVVTTHKDEVVCVAKLVDGVLELKETGYSVGSDIILAYNFKPIKKEPINIAKENKVLDVKIPVEILGRKELINAKVIINGNKIVVKFPSGIKGVASCCPEDKFDEQKGIKIASARAIKKQIINDLDKNIAELVK